MYGHRKPKSNLYPKDLDKLSVYPILNMHIMAGLLKIVDQYLRRIIGWDPNIRNKMVTYDQIK